MFVEPKDLYDSVAHKPDFPALHGAVPFRDWSEILLLFLQLYEALLF